jgi:hypothetical protein
MLVQGRGLFFGKACEMIWRSYPPSGNRMFKEKQHKGKKKLVDRDTHTLLLDDMHQAYELPDAKTIKTDKRMSRYAPGCGRMQAKDGWPCSIKKVWDQYDVDRLVEDRDIPWDKQDKSEQKKLLAKLMTFFPKPLRGDGAIWKITGSYKQLIEIADKYADNVLGPGHFGHGPSGDDDTFDYWPGAMEMLQNMVIDLDTIAGGGTKHYDALRKRYRKWLRDVVQEPIPEYNFDGFDKALPEEDEDWKGYKGSTK